MGGLELALAAALAAGAPGGCPDVLEYSGWRPAADQKWDWRWPERDPKLVILGAEHARDPSHPQFARIAAEFEAAAPTLVLFEGPDRGEKASAEETIREAGESGFARFLARRSGTRLRSLEPSPGDQFGALAGQFPIDQVMLFFVLRETARLRDREKLSGEALDAAVTKLLENAAKIGPGLPFSDLAGLAAASERYWPGRDWRSADPRWFQPGGDDKTSGGVFLAAINRADSMNRDRHMVRLIAEAAKAGERTFVVVGRNHVPMQVPALACALGD